MVDNLDPTFAELMALLSGASGSGVAPQGAAAPGGVPLRDPNLGPPISQPSYSALLEALGEDQGFREIMDRVFRAQAAQPDAVFRPPFDVPGPTNLPEPSAPPETPVAPVAPPMLEPDRQVGGDAGLRGVPGVGKTRGFNPADPYGVDFGEDVSSALGKLSNLPGSLGVAAKAAKSFVDLIGLPDARSKSDAFFGGLISGETPTVPGTGITISRRSGGGDLSALEAQAEADIEANVGGAFGDFGGGGGDAGSGGDNSGADSQGGGMGCFLAGTPILLADGSEKPIEEIRLGDQVASFPEDEIYATPSGREVVGLWMHKAEEFLVLEGPMGPLAVTPEHPFVTYEGEWCAIGDIGHERNLITADGRRHRRGKPDVVREKTVVYNLEVAGYHTYVAGGLRVHNIKHKGGYISEDRVPGRRRADVQETLQEGEYVLPANRVSKIGRRKLEALRTGKAKVQMKVAAAKRKRKSKARKARRR